MEIIERAAGHYEAQDVEFGRVYRWYPECIVVECKCGKKLTFDRSELLSGSVSSCECGEDEAAGVCEEAQGEVVGHLLEDDEVVHPWRYWRTSRNTGIPF